MSPFFAISPFYPGDENPATNPRNQYQAARLALGCMLLNWSGLGALCASRSLAELLAVFCCNLEEDHLIQSLLGLFFDIFDLRWVFWPLSLLPKPFSRLKHDFYSDDCDQAFHELVHSHEELKTWAFDNTDFTIEKMFVIAECSAKFQSNIRHGSANSPIDLATTSFFIWK